MSKEFSVQLPKLGESITSATIVQWFKKEGDFVKLDEPLLEVSTDKVNSEIPSPVSGVITKIMAYENQELDVGSTLCSISTEAVQAKVASEEVNELSIQETEKQTPSSQENKDFLSPAVLKLAQTLGIDFSFLKTIRGTGYFA